MKKKYEGSSKLKCAQLQSLGKDFETLQIKDNESITNYYDKAIGVVNRMWIHGEVIEDTIIVLKILHSMAPKYNYVVCSIEESKNIDSLSLEELPSSLVVHEQKVNHGTVTNEQALKASHLLQIIEAEVQEEGVVATEMVEDKISRTTMINQMFKARGEVMINNLTNQKWSALGVKSLVITVLYATPNCPKTKKNHRSQTL